MTEITKGKAPDYTSDGAAAWINKDKNGNEYISVKILGQITVNLFPNKNKGTQEPQNTPKIETIKAENTNNA